MAKAQVQQAATMLFPLALPTKTADECKKARVILEYAAYTASSLLTAYETVRGARKTKAGTSTDQEQDILRAMLVMAAAGLDGTTKQLIRDAMPALVATDSAVRGGLETFISRQLRGDVDLPETAAGPKFMARLLAAPSHQAQAIEEYIRELTGGSLQSAEELLRVASAFGLQPQDVGLEKVQKPKVQAIFDIRNKIIHELDMNLQGRQRKRNQRRVDDMKGYVETLLGIGATLMKQVSDTLMPTTAVTA